MPKITIYQKPTCSTCREAIKLLNASGQAYTAVNYYEKPFTKVQLRGLLKKAGLKATDILRTKDEIFMTLGLASKSLAEEELLGLMIKHPDLIQRPIVEKDETVMLARPAETITRLL